MPQAKGPPFENAPFIGHYITNLFCPPNNRGQKWSGLTKYPPLVFKIKICRKNWKGKMNGLIKLDFQ